MVFTFPMSFYQCFVKVDKTTVVFSTVELNPTVNELKTFIWDRLGIKPEKQICKYGGKIVKNDVVLKDKIMQDGTVYVYLNTHSN